MSTAQQIAAHLRTSAVETYLAGGHTESDVARALGVFPTAVRRLVSRKDWTIETGIRFLSALGLTVQVTVRQ